MFNRRGLSFASLPNVRPRVPCVSLCHFLPVIMPAPNCVAWSPSSQPLPPPTSPPLRMLVYLHHPGERLEGGDLGGGTGKRERDRERERDRSLSRSATSWGHTHTHRLTQQKQTTNMNRNPLWQCQLFCYKTFKQTNPNSLLLQPVTQSHGIFLNFHGLKFEEGVF